MAQTTIILHFGLEDGRNADALVAGEALIAWVALAKEAARAAGDEQAFVMELLSAERSSLRFTQQLRRIENAVASIRAGSKDYPNLSFLALALAVALAGGLGSIAMEAAFMPDSTVKLSEEDRALLRAIPGRVTNSPGVKQKSKEFFRIIEQDRAIKEVGMAASSDRPPLFIIPRGEFAERSGLWLPSEDLETRDQQEEINVILVKPDLRSMPHTWSFQRSDGTSIQAKMDDPDFLAALGSTGIPAQLREGIPMRIVISWQEAEGEEGWRYVNRSRRVIRVLSPLPGASRSPFALANPPEEN